MFKSVVFVPMLAFAPTALAQTVWESLRAHVETNQRAVEAARAYTFGNRPDPEVSSAILRYEDEPEKDVFLQAVDYEVLSPAELEILGFPFPREAGWTYVGFEFARPYLIQRPDVLSPGTDFRVIGIDPRGRTFWFGHAARFEITSLRTHTRALHAFEVVGPFGGGAGALAILREWKEVATRTDYYRATRPAATPPATPKSTCDANLGRAPKPAGRSWIGRWFGRS